jgi:hypothetical protein
MMESADRVRANTSEETNRKIDRATEARVREYTQKSSEEITRRIDELDREWDIERLLETNASALAFTGLALGVTKDIKWLLLPASAIIASPGRPHAQ